MKKTNETLKSLCLLEEIETSIKLIQIGLGELQNIDMVNNFYYLPFQLLSSGIERLMKCIICLGYLNKNSKYPHTKSIKTHDLIELKNDILKDYFSKKVPALQEDYDFISKDQDLMKLIYLLSEFGKFARYYNLDIITGAEKPSIDVKQLWQEYETQLLLNSDYDFEQLLDPEKGKEAYEFISRELVVKIELFIRALSRQFTLGELGAKAKQFSSPVYPFLMMTDDEIGRTDYRKQTTRYKERKKKVHKRTIVDNIKSKFNKDYKSKTILKKDYVGEWPFRTDKVIIECRNKHWCTVTIDGKDYALNGAASSRFKLEDVHSAGMAILGKSIGPFIDEALKLAE